MIRAVIADDHHLVRQGIRLLLERADDIQVIGEAEDGQIALELTKTHIPDVLLIDIAMPRMNGLQVIERIRAAGLPTQAVILSANSDEAIVRHAVQIGAQGYLLKRSVSEELLIAIRAAARGDLYLSPEIARNVLSNFQNAPRTSALDALTTREREILQLIAEGNTNHEIAAQLSVSVKTIEKHRTRLMEKLNIHDLAGLIRFAIKHGVISLDT